MYYSQREAFLQVDVKQNKRIIKGKNGKSTEISFIANNALHKMLQGHIKKLQRHFSLCWMGGWVGGREGGRKEGRKEMVARREEGP